LQYTTGGTTISSTSEEFEKSDFSPTSEYVAWTPFPGLISRTLGFVVITIMFASLEIVLHVSRMQTGLGDIYLNDYTNYLWTIIATSAMWSIATFSSGIDFNTRCLTPHAHLKRSTGATPKQSLQVSFLHTRDSAMFWLPSMHGILRYWQPHWLPGLPSF
jgi:hypothetical protein